MKAGIYISIAIWAVVAVAFVIANGPPGWGGP